MNHRRNAWVTVLIVLFAGAAGLIPIWGTSTATARLSGDFSVGPFYDDPGVSHDGHWFVFKGLRPNSTDQYDLFLVDLTVTPYAPMRIEMPALAVDGYLRYSENDRFVLIEREVSTFQWELYVYDLISATLYHVASGQDGIGATMSPDERFLLLQPGYGNILYSMPLTGGTPVVLTPPDFPDGLDYYNFYEFTPDQQHVIMTASSFLYTETGAVGYAPLTGTGVTLWSAAQEHPSGASVLFSADSSVAYVATNFFQSEQNAEGRLWRIPLTGEPATTLLSGGAGLVTTRGDDDYGFVHYRESNGIWTLYRLSLADAALTPLLVTPHTLRYSVVTNAATRQIAMGTFHDLQTTVYVGGYDPPMAPTAVITVPSEYVFDFTRYQFSIDGERVIVTEELDSLEYRLHQVAATGESSPTVLLSGTSTYGFPRPSNQSAAVWTTVRNNEQWRVAYVPLDGSPPLTTFVPPEGTSVRLQQVFGQDQVVVLTNELDSGLRSYETTDTRPAASVSAMRTLMEEGMTTTLNITLVPSSSVPVTLTFELTGTANAADIEIMPSVVAIPAYSENAVVVVRAVADGEAESEENATLMLQPGIGILVQPPDTVMLRIVDQFERTFLPLIRYFD